MKQTERDQIDKAKAALITSLKYYMPATQRGALAHYLRGEERLYFADMLLKLEAHIAAMPVVYSQDGKGDEAVIGLHYFHGGSDWWITERDGEWEPDDYDRSFGVCSLGGDKAEFGYVSIKQLTDNGIELDLYWNQKTVAQVRK